MGKEKTGRPKGIDSWRDRHYLDLERRRPHIPKGGITWDMLTDEVKRRLPILPVGYYSGDGSTFLIAVDEIGRTVFVPIIWGNSRYGLCVYGGELGVYGTAKYGEVSYGEYVYLTGDYGGTGGYGNIKYG